MANAVNTIAVTNERMAYCSIRMRLPAVWPCERRGYPIDMKLISRTFLGAAALAVLIGTGLSGGSASAQENPYGYGPQYVPPYTTWQPQWNQHKYDRRHVILGMVTGFSPYRLSIARRNGVVQTVDLKNGTRIFPTGATPSNGERAAILGYWSNGTFVANRVVLRT